MVEVNDFFIPQNSIAYIADEKYKGIDVLIKSLEAVARMTYKSLYVIDYFRRNFLYVSDNPLFLCGLPTEKVREMGYLFYLENVPEEDINMLVEINRAGFDFFEKIPREDRRNYVISYDFHLMEGEKKTLVNHKLTPILLNDEGKLWLAACMVSMSPKKVSGNIEVRKIDNAIMCWRYSLTKHQWNKKDEPILKKIEKQILMLSAQGLTINEIADKLCLTSDTIKFHRKNIFEKLDVKNIVEAIIFASNFKLI
jgi:DNA-binding CsgD family transcriptional regulator